MYSIHNYSVYSIEKVVAVNGGRLLSIDDGIQSLIELIGHLAFLVVLLISVPQILLS